MKAPPGHTILKTEHLRGEQLAWAALAIYQMPAVIVDGKVMALDTANAPEHFDAEKMLASILSAITVEIVVPNELVDETGRG